MARWVKRHITKEQDEAIREYINKHPEEGYSTNDELVREAVRKFLELKKLAKKEDFKKLYDDMKRIQRARDESQK